MLHELTRVLPPPASPVDPGKREEWPSIEAAVELSLPPDYKDFVNRYGSGGIDDWIFIFNPFSTREYGNLRNEIAGCLGALRQLRDEFHEEIPYPIHPEPGGLVPWGCTSNGDVLYWVTRGPPSDWTVCINEGRGPEWEEYPYSMVGFLVKLLTGEITVRIFPDDVRLGPGSRFMSK